MKKYLLAVMLLLAGFTLTKAQKKMPTAQELTVKNMDQLTERLKLSQTQRNIIYNYTFDMYKLQLDLLKKQQAGTSQEDDAAKFYKFQNETNDNIKNILKGDQVAEYDKFIEENLNGTNKKKKNKKGKKNEEEEVITGISGLKSNP
jgi:protein CpxP